MGARLDLKESSKNESRNLLLLLFCMVFEYFFFKYNTAFSPIFDHFPLFEKRQGILLTYLFNIKKNVILLQGV